jgi:hypothetical protein
MLITKNYKYKKTKIRVKHDLCTFVHDVDREDTSL